MTVHSSPISKWTSGYSSFNLAATLSVWIRASCDERATPQENITHPAIGRAGEHHISLVFQRAVISTSSRRRCRAHVHIRVRDQTQNTHTHTCKALLYLTLAGSNPDDPANLSVPILPGPKKKEERKLFKLLNFSDLLADVTSSATSDPVGRVLGPPHPDVLEGSFVHDPALSVCTVGAIVSTGCVLVSSCAEVI